jgi:putative ABC transport system permease protein
MKFLRLVLAGLGRKKLRTALTLASILVAFVLFALLAAIREALSAGVSAAGADRLVVRHRVSIIQLLPEAYKARMERIPGVVSATHMTWFGGIYQDPRNFFAQMPVEIEPFLEMYKHDFALPKDQKQAWAAARTGAIVGRSTADRFGWKIGQRIPLQSPIWRREGGSMAWEFDLVGIFDAAKPGADTTNLYFRYDYFDEARGFGKGMVGWYMVKVGDPAKAPDAAAAIDAEFANSPFETKAEPEGAFVQGWAQQIGDIGAITMAILASVFFTILLVAGNTMAQSVRERVGEIGVLKALGFTDESVLALVLGESCLVAGAGGLAGLAIGAGVVRAMAQPLVGMLPNFRLPAGDLLAGLGIVTVLGLVAGIVPALQARRLRIADALRRQT